MFHAVSQGYLPCIQNGKSMTPVMTCPLSRHAFLALSARHKEKMQKVHKDKYHKFTTALYKFFLGQAAGRGAFWIPLPNQQKMISYG